MSYITSSGLLYNISSCVSYVNKDNINAQPKPYPKQDILPKLYFIDEKGD